MAPCSTSFNWEEPIRNMFNPKLWPASRENHSGIKLHFFFNFRFLINPFLSINRLESQLIFQTAAGAKSCLRIFYPAATNAKTSVTYSVFNAE